MTRSFLPFAGVLVLALVVFGCGNSAPNMFSDPVLVKIADLQDRRQADSLYAFLDHPEPVYRRQAALAFASIQECSEIDRLGKLLVMDSDATVRAAAAFALGQIKHSSAERLLLAAVAKEKENGVLSEILAAYGKATSLWRLDPSSFLDDSVRRAGLARSIYHAGLREKTDTLADRIAVNLLESEAVEPRLTAAHYFARTRRHFEKAEPVLAEAATADLRPDIRMAAALAVGNGMSDSSLQILRSITASERDPRVVVNAVRALLRYPFAKTRGDLYELVKHNNLWVATVAAEGIAEQLPSDDWIDVSNLINWVKPWQVRAPLYRAVLKASGRADVAAEVQALYAQAVDVYEKSAWLRSLRDYHPSRGFLVNVIETADQPVLRSSAADAFANIASGILSASVRQEVADQIGTLIEKSNDAAVVGILAQALSSNVWHGVIRDFSFLEQAKARLTLPQHVETVQALESARANLLQREPGPVNLPFNHAIDWDFVKQIPADQRVRISTTRGTLVIRLYVEQAPGSVANFIKLAQAGYFNEKVFHRVVPNFVVQTGCPRGDGWGSENYSIRSEFSQRKYRTGSVGMASAGKDTEATQWFITHSPTPHLDGRYTLFAEVLSGFEVMDLIQIGDRITRVTVENF